MKEWKPGKANKYWEKLICYSEMKLARDTLRQLEYITGLPTFNLKEKSGEEIVKSVEDYYDSRVTALKLGEGIHEAN